MIRGYQASDVDQVMEIWDEASVIAHSFLDPDFFETERRRIIDSYLPMSETYVYEKDDQIAGFISLLSHEVGGLFVAPRQQRQGIGRCLIDYAQALKGILELSVFKENHTGRAFYERCGFQTVSEVLDQETGHMQVFMRRPQR